MWGESAIVAPVSGDPARLGVAMLVREVFRIRNRGRRRAMMRVVSRNDTSSVRL